jgi:hypothetical protein
MPARPLSASVHPRHVQLPGQEFGSNSRFPAQPQNTPGGARENDERAMLIPPRRDMGMDSPTTRFHPSSEPRRPIPVPDQKADLPAGGRKRPARQAVVSAPTFPRSHSPIFPTWSKTIVVFLTQMCYIAPHTPGPSHLRRAENHIQLVPRLRRGTHCTRGSASHHPSRSMNDRSKNRPRRVESCKTSTSQESPA